VIAGRCSVIGDCHWSVAGPNTGATNNTKRPSAQKPIALAWGLLDRLLEDGRLQIEGVSATGAGAIRRARQSGGKWRLDEHIHRRWRNVSALVIHPAGGRQRAKMAGVAGNRCRADQGRTAGHRQRADRGAGGGTNCRLWRACSGWRHRAKSGAVVRPTNNGRRASRTLVPWMPFCVHSPRRQTSCRVV
jgi:hypothetical protein